MQPVFSGTDVINFLDNTPNENPTSLGGTISNIEAKEKINSEHKYNYDKKSVPCTKCFQEVKVTEAVTHRYICKEALIPYEYGVNSKINNNKNSSNEILYDDNYFYDMENIIFIKRAILSNIEAAHKLLSSQIVVSSKLEELSIYKNAIIAYNELIEAFQSKKLPNKHEENLSYLQYQKIINKDLQMLTHNLSLTTNSEIEEQHLNYLQQPIDYKIYNLVEVKITREDLLAIKKAEDLANKNLINNDDNNILIYQKAIPIYKNLINKLHVNTAIKLDKKYKGSIDTNSQQIYSATEKLEVSIKEKPLAFLKNNFLFMKNFMLRKTSTGKIFSLAAIADNLSKQTLTSIGPFPLFYMENSNLDYRIIQTRATFGIPLNIDSSKLLKEQGKTIKYTDVFIEININSTPNYYTKDSGIYFTLTIKEGVSPYFRLVNIHSSIKETCILNISYIDKHNYKNHLFNTSFLVSEFINNFKYIDVFDPRTKFGHQNKSEDIIKLNTFFNDDGIGMQYIKENGYDSMFSIELQTENSQNHDQKVTPVSSLSVHSEFNNSNIELDTNSISSDEEDQVLKKNKKIECSSQ